MNRFDSMSFARSALAVAVAIVASAPAFAQNTTAAVGGLVTGADGKPVAGAAVSILHRESGSVNNVTTGPDGRYSARGLRVGGPYAVTVTAGGASARRDDVFLTLAETVNLDIALGAPAGSTVVVTGRADTGSRLDSTAMGSGTNLGTRELNALASIQRNLQDYARTDPRLAQTDKERGEISAAGQNTRYNSITIDGVTINDTFGLESNNLPTIKQPISIDAIQSVQVNLSNYDVTQKGYTGANINAVTKSGTNDFKGSIYYVTRDDNLVGKRLANNRSDRTSDDYVKPAPFKEDTKGVTLGGPIIKDKLFFFASYEELKSTRTAPDVGPIGSPRTNVAVTQSAIDQAIAIAKNTWGADVGSSEVPTGTAVSVKDTLLKLDWNINDNHRANVRYSKTQQNEPIFANLSSTGTPSVSLSSNWYNQAKEIETLVGQWFADWTPDFSTELKVSQRNYDSRPTPMNGVRLPQITVRFTGALPPGVTGLSTGNRDLIMGTERSRHFNILTTKTEDAYLGANWTLGAHELKFGVDYANNDVYNAFLQDTNGQYRFQCEPGTYSFGSISNCSTATAAQVEAAALENFRNGRPSFYQVQLPRAGKTLTDGVAIWSAANTGLFVQDTWKADRKLNVVFGVRLDTQSVPDKPIFNPTAAAAPGTPDPVTGRATGGFGLDNSVTLDGNTLVQPRVGFNWNLDSGERRAQLRGGLGLFQGAAANVWLSNPFSNTGMATAVLSCSSLTACNTANARFSANPDGQPSLTGVPPAANVDFIDKGLQQPSVWKANLAFETELPKLPFVGTLVAGAEWLLTKTKSGIYYEHLNLGAPTRTGPDGRQMFWIPQAYNPSCWDAAGNAVTSGACASTLAGGQRNRALNNPNFANVLVARPTSQGGGDALTLSIGQPSNSGFGWNLAYTRTTAEEVSPLTSSVSNSNWLNRNIFNPNENVLQNSNYLVKDRVSASLTWAKAFVGKYRTSFGMFYEGRKGKPYSWTYLNDLNGDGVAGNDLMYIPKGPGSGEVVFRGGATEEAAFWQIVDANPALAAAKGGVVGRNNSFAPWVNNVDVRVSQEFPGFMPSHKATFVLDFLNFGNLLNKKWGRIDEVAFPSNRSFVNYGGIDSQGRYVYSLGTLKPLVTRQVAGESQWAIQMTLRYEF